MPSRTLHVRIPPKLAAQLAAFCAAYGQTPSAVVRGALAQVLAQPALYVDLGDYPVPALDVDLRTPEQIHAWDQYQRELEAFDLGAVAREQGYT